ncbi:MAG: hypothetical protein IJC71_08775 [Clostridia bacterium]|nr:hypothetical protein [Clostridia bacterium]
MNQNHTPVSERFLRFYKIAVFVFPALALLTAIGYFLTMKTAFDPVIGHVDPASGVFILTMAAVLLSLIGTLAAALLIRRTASLTAVPDENPVTVFGAVLAAGAGAFSLFPAALDLMRGAALSKPALIAAVLFPFIAVSMILSVIPSLRQSKGRQFCAILAAVAVNFSMFADYFDFTLPLNSPVRNFTTAAKAAVLLYLLSEARFSFSMNSGRPTLLFTVCTSALTASVTLGFSVGAILSVSFSGLSANPNPPMLTLVLCAAFGIHAAGRLFSLIPCIGAYREKEPDKAKKA